MQRDGTVVQAPVRRLPRFLAAALAVSAGLVLWWLLNLVGGTAHADDGGAASATGAYQADLLTQVDGQASAIVARASNAADRGVHAVAGPATHTTEAVTATVDESVGTVAGEIRAGGASSPAPVRAVTDTVARTLDRAADTVGAAGSRIGGVGDGITETPDEPVAPDPSSAGSASASSAPTTTPTEVHRAATAGSVIDHSVTASTHAPSRASTAAGGSVLPATAALTHASRALPTVAHRPVIRGGFPSPVPAPAPGPDPAPTAPSPTPVPALSLIGVLAAVVMSAPLLRRLRVRGDAFTLPLAPAYPPGCSPD